MEYLTPTNILFLITIATVLVNIYLSLKKPQEKGEIVDAVFKVEFDNLKSKLDLIQNNDLHEIKGMINTHILNQNANEREISDKFARLETKVEILMKK